MRHLGLFEGIGGFSLAARWMGWETVSWCEWNEFGQKVLRHHFPEAEGHGDITKTDFTKYANTIDILTGGFPCQPYSQAGKRKGKDDERHLWPEMLRAIREIQPVYVVGENVRGLTNWNGGLVFDEVQADLENEGYEVLPFLLPACAVGAPHRRDRIWFISRLIPNAGHDGFYGHKEPQERRNGIGSGFSFNEPDALRSAGIIANADRLGQQRSRRPKQPIRSAQNGNWKASWANANGGWPTEPPIRGGNDGLPAGLAGLTVSDYLESCLSAYGNAIVPQVALQIYKAIEQYELLTPFQSGKL